MNVFNDIKATQDYSKRLPKSNSVEMNQLSDEINGLLTHIEDENIQEKERQRHLRELAECDPLTGINNKKAIEQKIKCTLCQGHYDFSFSDFYFIFVCCVEASK